MQNKIIAIIGAGVMGSATALDLAYHGFQVLLKDISAEALSHARKKIKNEYRSICIINRDFASVTLDTIFQRISFQDNYSNIEAADIIIENINENSDDKISEYRILAEKTKKNALFALNTSCISITKLAAHL